MCIRDSPASPPPLIILLTSGDPLFFGLGRLLLAHFPAAQLTFHPHLSSVQLAFSRLKRPWQEARLISVHGRSLDALIQALQQGSDQLAVLTDGTNTPTAIAALVDSLNLPSRYQIWVCENLGGNDERITELSHHQQIEQSFAPLNVVVLLRQTAVVSSPPLDQLPLLGLLDRDFLSFSDRPGLMTKREVRILALGELALHPNQVVWDIGAGTGSVSAEMARLCPSSQVYAIEKTTAGITLIQQNCQRLQVSNVIAIHGSAPNVLEPLPTPDRIFIGGSGGNLTAILDTCGDRLSPHGRIVLALATLQHLGTTLSWLDQHPGWNHQLLQVQLSRSVAIANLTRFAPLNPVTLVVIER
ncbi:precorrin-6y C5,15-methyltransferase (decarboxylating) subunit CbiE, partial [Pantanalinema rosaneae CENA516]|uniref:precorrin-6y C5,15-methyltransferase (decarboxylating) subunit CbiE n=1 Tax=Pantanalinema rosaneae TaxID=1620701 RepID=UPI003D6FDDE5